MTAVDSRLDKAWSSITRFLLAKHIAKSEREAYRIIVVSSVACLIVAGAILVYAITIGSQPPVAHSRLRSNVASRLSVLFPKKTAAKPAAPAAPAKGTAAPAAKVPVKAPAQKNVPK